MSPRGEVWSRWFERLPWWAHAVAVAVLLAGGWALVYAAGGTRTAWQHVFYIAIVFAALPFGVGGGLVAGLVATLLCGPAMPLDVAAGHSQELADWLVRGVFFVAVGGLAGVSTATLRRGFETGLSRQLQAELERARTAPDKVDPGWELRIRQMLDRGAFHTVFQPIYALDDGRLLSVEALTRFDTEPVYPPDVWFTQAAAVDLGVELELATAKAALEAAGDLDGRIPLSLNASPALLADDRLAQLLAWHNGRPIVIEITEHAVVDDYPQLDAALRVLRAQGIQVAVDDAGAGFASLRHIVRLQPDFIKLDLSLTQNLRNDPVRRPLGEALIRFAHDTDSAIIVEGIETAADLATWQELGAHAAQGYLLGRPGPLPVAPTTDALPRRAQRRTSAAATSITAAKRSSAR